MRHYLITILALFLIIIIFYPAAALAHCDGNDGPVVLAAKEALKTGDVNLILIWVQEDDEAQIREVFEHTLKVRNHLIVHILIYWLPYSILFYH